jgi:hypothetical protein
MKPCPQPRTWRLLGLALLLAHAGAVTGCAHTDVASAKPAQPVQQPLPVPAASEPRPLRVIVQFKGAAAPNSERLLKELSRQAQAPVRYMASVSPDTHVYAIELRQNQDPRSVLESLSSLSGVARVEEDGVVKINTIRR